MSDTDRAARLPLPVDAMCADIDSILSPNYVAWRAMLKVPLGFANICALCVVPPVLPTIDYSRLKIEHDYWYMGPGRIKVIYGPRQRVRRESARRDYVARLQECEDLREGISQ